MLQDMPHLYCLPKILENSKFRNISGPKGLDVGQWPYVKICVFLSSISKVEVSAAALGQRNSEIFGKNFKKNDNTVASRLEGIVVRSALNDTRIQMSGSFWAPDANTV